MTAPHSRENHGERFFSTRGSVWLRSSRIRSEKRFDKIESALLTNGGNKPERSLGRFSREDPLKGFVLAEFLLRGDVGSMKKELIATHLKLTDSESTRAWQVYEQYSAEISKINGKKTGILKEYLQAYDTLTDDQADDLIRRWLETDIEQAKVRHDLAGILRRVLSGKKAATFLQLERRISMMMDVQLTSGLPLAQSEV
jgi:hypothetical protein